MQQLDQQVSEIRKRNFKGSLTQFEEELRDAYLNFKDLKQRCQVDVRQKSGLFDSGLDDNQVFYFKPETFLLDEPERQRVYREQLLRRISHPPKSVPATYLADELHRSMCQTVADRSTPKLTKQFLITYFQQRRYSLQHMKYKLLCRWAHHVLTSEQLEMISPEATFLYGKLEYNLDQALTRYERLAQDDYFDQAIPENRPSTRIDSSGEAQYTENLDLPAQSLIREDDIEVYVRGTTYRNKINKTANKFISRLKWLPGELKYEIFEKVISLHLEIKQGNIKRQKKLRDRVMKNAKKLQAQTLSEKTANCEQQLDEVTDNYYCTKYERLFMSHSDQILNNWRAIHDEVPRFVSDTHLLKIKVLDSAAKFNLSGDIELDAGHSFSYQVTMFFPSYLQKQILKSQFSLYDTQTAKKPEFDTNIFRDLSLSDTVSNSEQYERISTGIRILRLKSAAYWIDYVVLRPTACDWHTKQQALLNPTPVDSLLKTTFDFLDVNDSANVVQVIEEIAVSHKKTLENLAKQNPHEQTKQVSLQTFDGNKQIEVDLISQTNSANLATQLDKHLIGDVFMTAAETTQQQSRKVNPLSQLPQHLLVSMYTLRHVESRDAKTKLLYTLNYFRSIQKRLAIDLREFATRDRIDGQGTNPFIFSREGHQNAQNHVNLTSTPLADLQQNSETSKVSPDDPPAKMTVFDFQKIRQLNDMASVRSYKLNGKFNQRVFSTCPTLAQCHTSTGEPLSHRFSDEEEGEPLNINQRSVSLINRIDFVEIDEAKEEIYVRDDQGIYLMHDCALQDLSVHQEYLVLVGSYFIQRAESLCSPDTKPLPARDRQQVCQDLLTNEAQFQFHKARLIQVYIECYEHVTCPMEQQRLMQIITDVMQRTVRLNLQANYFTDAYEGEIRLLRKQFELMSTVVDLQIRLEKTENHRLQNSLNLSYTLANQYASNKWKYADAESLLQAVEMSRKQRQDVEEFALRVKKDREAVRTSQELLSKGIPPPEPLPQPDESNIEIKEENTLSDFDALSSRKEEEEGHKSEDDFMQPAVQNQFTQLLGVPTVTIENIYQGYQERDTNVVQLMKQHSNFIAVYEGYPEFLTMLTHKSVIDNNLTFRVNEWSQQTGALDFYDSLDIVNNVHAIVHSVQEELYDGLKLWEPSLMTLVDVEVAEASLRELRKVIKIQEGSEPEYGGRELVEDESILGSSDKLIYYAKEMISDLTTKPKNLLDPFLVAKLDIQSVRLFNFPKVEIALNKFAQRKQGIIGLAHMLQMEKNCLTGIAKEKIDSKEKLIQDQISVLKSRQLTVPSLLQTYCNMVELLRLRQEIIMTATECHALQLVYKRQCDFIGQRESRTEQEESIDFTQHYETKAQFVDFLEDGPSHLEEIKLAIREFDMKLLTNFNFRNPDSFKLNCLTSGLEEVRAICYYQVMQKHTLIVATRLNQLLIDVYQRAQSEINLLINLKFALPNSVIDYSRLISSSSVALNNQAIKALAKEYKQNANQFVTPVFYHVHEKRQLPRATINKEFGQYLQLCLSVFPESPVTVARIMRNFRVKLVTKYVSAHLHEVYMDALKVSSVRLCQSIRVFCRFFNFDPENVGLHGETVNFLKFESSQLLENFPRAYLPSEFTSESKNNFGLTKKVTRAFSEKQTITDYRAIPSSVTLLNLGSSEITEQLRELRERAQQIRKQKWGLSESEQLTDQSPTVIDPESHLKQLLPTFTPCDFANLKECRHDYEEALDFGETDYAQKCYYYLVLDRVFRLEWFIRQLQLGAESSIQFENAIQSGMPYFSSDHFDRRIMNALDTAEVKGQTAEIVKDQVDSLRSRRHIAKAIVCLKNQINSFIEEYTKTPVDSKSQFLTQYVELRYEQLIGCLYSQLESFYSQDNVKGVAVVQQAIAKVLKVDHLRVIYFKPGNYSVRDCIVDPSQANLENGDLIFGSIQYGKRQNFDRCVQPLKAQTALEPPQITLFQSLYLYDTLRAQNQTQYAGQLTKPLDLCILFDLTEDERSLCAKTFDSLCLQTSGFMESVHGDTSYNLNQFDETYQLSQLPLIKKFTNERTQALLLKYALLCWTNNTTLPQDPQKVRHLLEQMNSLYVWKVQEHKDLIAKQQQMLSTVQPSRQRLQQLAKEIDKLINDQSISTEEEFSRRDKVLATLRVEHAELKKKVQLDQYFTTKAQIVVFRHEIEKLIITAAIQTLDSESTALAKCFTMQAAAVQYHIHPFQQFAATFFDQVDPNSVLDVSNKVDVVQELLTKMRNRGTEVDTITSGPGVLMTIKDFNEILADFCRQSLADTIRQIKSRTETFSLVAGHLREQLYLKDQKIKTLESRLDNCNKNFDKIVSTRVFGQGNQLVYELDSTKRILNIFRQNLRSLEDRLMAKILGEQLNKFRRKDDQIELKNKKFTDYKEHLLRMIGDDIQKDRSFINQQIKTLADQAKTTDQLDRKRTQMYTGSQQNDFQHKQGCTCYKPNPNHPWPTVETAQLDMLSELEAREQLAHMCTFVRKQRAFFRTKEMFLMTKHQQELSRLASQQSSNTLLWEQLAESQKRESVIKQELLSTQEILEASRKQIERMSSEIRLLNLDRTKLQKYLEKLKHLDNDQEPSTQSKIQVTDQIEREKLIRTLTKQEEQLQTFKAQQQRFDLSISIVQKEKKREQMRFKRIFEEEREQKSALLTRMQQLQAELQMIETGDSSLQSAWKRKCLDLFDLCQTLRCENETLKTKLDQLVTDSSALLNIIQKPKTTLVQSGQLPALQQSRPYLQNYQNHSSEDTGLPQSDGVNSAAKLLNTTPGQHNVKSHSVMRTAPQQRLLSPAPNLHQTKHNFGQRQDIRKIMSSKGNFQTHYRQKSGHYHQAELTNQPYHNRVSESVVPFVTSGTQMVIPQQQPIPDKSPSSTQLGRQVSQESKMISPLLAEHQRSVSDLNVQSNKTKRVT